MYNTKNDLSAGLAKIDFVALERTVDIAFKTLMQDVYDTQKKMYSAIDNKEYTGVWLAADSLQSLTKELAIVSETLYTVKGAKQNRKIEIINRYDASA